MNQDSTNTADEKLVPIASAARRFGYQDPKHFRISIAPRHGIQSIRQGAHWFFKQSEVDTAFAALTSKGPTGPAK